MLGVLLVVLAGICGVALAVGGITVSDTATLGTGSGTLCAPAISAPNGLIIASATVTTGTMTTDCPAQWVDSALNQDPTKQFTYTVTVSGSTLTICAQQKPGFTFSFALTGTDDFAAWGPRVFLNSKCGLRCSILHLHLQPMSTRQLQADRGDVYPVSCRQVRCRRWFVFGQLHWGLFAWVREYSLVVSCFLHLLLSWVIAHFVLSMQVLLSAGLNKPHGDNLPCWCLLVPFFILLVLFVPRH